MEWDMNRYFSVLREMPHTGKWAPTLNSEIHKSVVEEQALTDLDRQTIELGLDQWERPDNSAQGVGRAKARKNKRRPEHLNRINERVVALHQFDTVAAEQYRKLYLEIAQARHTRALQTLLLTSALAGDGKSLSSLNLAITSAAHEGSHGVLLIDTDLRQPSLHQYMGIHPKWDLANYLLGDVESAHIFVKTQIPGLTVITAGSKDQQSHRAVRVNEDGAIVPGRKVSKVI